MVSSTSDLPSDSQHPPHYKKDTDGQSSEWRSHTSNVESVVRQEALFSFVNAYRVGSHWLYFNATMILFIVQSIPILVPPENKWGYMFRKFYNAVFCLRSLGMQYAPYNAFKYISGILFSVYIILLLLIALSYYLYMKGSPWFNRVRNFVVFIAAAGSLFGLAIMYSVSSFWDCTNTHLSRFPTIQCYGSNNLTWGIISIIVLILQLFFSVFTVAW
jgi:hypothetical protein